MLRRSVAWRRLAALALARLLDRPGAPAARRRGRRRAGAAALPLDPGQRAPGLCKTRRRVRAAGAAAGPVSLGGGDPATGETRVVIDLLTQLFYVYRGDQLVGVATISSGKKGKETPLGFWAVMLKKKQGFSRKYDNAPMPFMQMYDDKGIAFHAGPNPGYPASHGCVRLPLKFAERLYGLTKLGTKVTIEG